MRLPDDVHRYLARHFGPQEVDQARALLESSVMHDGSFPSERLVRCAAVASGGSLDRLRMEVETLKRDYRDVIVEGEYVPHGRKLIQVRDLDKPIPDDL